MLASAAIALMLAAAAVALVERLAVAFALALVLAGASVGAVVSLHPTRAGPLPPRSCGTGRRCTASGLRGPGRRDRGVAERLQDRRHQGLPVPPDRRRRRRHEPLPPLRQLVPERDVPRRPVPDALQYSDYLQLALRLPSADGRMLYIGLGGGSAPKRTWRDFPGVRIDVVELDPEVVDIAYKYFAVPRDPRLTVDGRGRPPLRLRPRRPLGRDRHRRLLLRLDSVPPRDAGVPRARRSRLTPGGLVATNIIGAVKGPDSRLFRSMLRTYRAVFPTVSVHPVLDAGRQRSRDDPQHHRRGR